MTAGEESVSTGFSPVTVGGVADGPRDLASGECVIAVAGVSADAPPPGLDTAPDGCELRFITSREQLAAEAADADVVFAWEPRLDWFEACWGWSRRLRWIAAASAGVDYLMFPALVSSDVVVTNSAGVFNDAMSEYALALVSAVCADLPATLRLQARREWLHRDCPRPTSSSSRCRSPRVRGASSARPNSRSCAATPGW